MLHRGTTHSTCIGGPIDFATMFQVLLSNDGSYFVENTLISLHARRVVSPTTIWVSGRIRESWVSVLVDSSSYNFMQCLLAQQVHLLMQEVSKPIQSAYLFVDLHTSKFREFRSQLISFSYQWQLRSDLVLDIQ